MLVARDTSRQGTSNTRDTQRSIESLLLSFRCWVNRVSGVISAPSKSLQAWYPWLLANVVKHSIMKNERKSNMNERDIFHEAGASTSTDNERNACAID